MSTSIFDTSEALSINEARRAFLNAWLPDMVKMNKMATALDVGCGLGFFSGYLKSLGLKVTAFDARPENIAEAKRRNPGVDFRVLNIEDSAVTQLGKFDIVFCFGLLYHLENPFRAVRNLYALTNRFLIAETQVAPSSKNCAILYEECNKQNQSLDYIVLMPTEPCFVSMFYKSGFSGVYASSVAVNHADFRSSLLRRKKRAVFISSREGCQKLDSLILYKKPGISFAREVNWLTPLGMLFDLRSIGLWVSKKLSDIFPSVWAVRLCRMFQYRYANSPKASPAGHFSFKRSRYMPLRIIRALLWQWFSLAAIKETFILSWYYGIKIMVHPKDEIECELFLTGGFEPNEFHFLDKILDEGMVFIDVGANIGLYSLFASKKAGPRGRVIAIEPSGREALKLKANISLNNLGNIRLIQAAASESRGRGDLLIAGDEHAGHNTLGKFAYDCSDLKACEPVEMLSLDEIAESEKLAKVDFIKIDTEGHEFFVLKGAGRILSKFHPTLLVELVDISLAQQGCGSKQIWEFLDGLGYGIYRFDSYTGLAVPTKEMPGRLHENIAAIHSSRLPNG